MEHLIIRIVENERLALCVQWSLYKDGYKIAQQEAALLSKLIVPAASMERRITVLVPGELVSLHAVTVPDKQRRHLHKVLPFIVEESLAEDVHLLHLAATQNAPKTLPLLVADIRKTLMQEWLKAFKDVSILPDLLIPETLVLPYPSHKWLIVYNDDKVWLRTSLHESFAVEPVMASDLLSLSLAKNTSEAMQECDVFVVENASKADAFLNDMQKRYPQLLFQPKTIPSEMDFFCETLLHQQPQKLPLLNLMQGEFRSSSNHTSIYKSWLKLAHIVAGCFILQLCISWGESAYYSFKADALRGESLAMYEKLFPADSKIIDPVSQFKSHLAIKDKSKSGFLFLLRKIAAKWDATASIEMQSLRYREDSHSLTIDLTAPNLETLNKLAEALNTNGLGTKVLYVSSEKGAVKGELSVKGSESE